MKKCPFCAEEIQDAAILCKHCGADLVRGTPPTRGGSNTVVVERRAEANAGVAAVLSLVIPGAGQMYCGRVGEGLAWLIFVVLGYAAFILPGAILHVLCIFGAYTSANRLNVPRAPRTDDTTRPIAVAFSFRQKAALVVMALGIGAFAISQATAPAIRKPVAAPTATAETPSATTTNIAADRLAGYSEQQRGAALRNTVISAGGKCDRAVRTFFKGSDSKAEAYWSIGCMNGLSYLVQIKPNSTGSTTVTDCSAYRKLANGDCFTKF